MATRPLVGVLGGADAGLFDQSGTYPPQPNPAHPFAEQVAALDTELDSVWPGWRAKQPFGRVEIDRKARIKWLLKRRQLLVACRDWKVLIRYDPRNPLQCYAHSVPPAADTLMLPNSQHPPAMVRPLYGKPVSAPHLAASCRLPLEAVEAALAEKPPHVRDARTWVIEWTEARVKAQARPKRTRKRKAATGPAAD